MADLTSTIQKEKVPYVSYKQVAEDRVYNIDVTDAALSGLAAVGTHNIVTIPVGYALLEAFVIVKQDADSAADGAAVQFKIGDDTLSAAIAQADLAEGEVIKLDGNKYGGVTDGTDTLESADVDGGMAGYCPDAADTIDMVVSGEALTALEFAIIVKLVDLDTALSDA